MNDKIDAETTPSKKPGAKKMNNQIAEEMVRDIAEALGLSPSDSRKAALCFIRKVRDLGRKPPTPDHIIREKKNSYEVVLPQKDKTKAQALLTRHIDEHSIPGTWEIEETKEMKRGVKHIGRKQKPKRKTKSSSKDVTEKFEKLSTEEQLQKLEELKEMA